MKQIFTLFSFLFFAAFANGQCTPDATATTWGLHPAPSIDITGLGPVPEIPACIGEAYSYTLSLVVPSSFDIPGVGSLGVDQATIVGITGLPSGMSYSECNPSSCIFPGGATSCFNITGTPDASNTPGNFILQITINFAGTVGVLPIDQDLSFPPLSSSFNPLSLPLDPYVIELRAAGACADAAYNLENEISLGSNVPNPFRGMTSIAVTAEKGGDYDFSVYNLLGEKISGQTHNFRTGENTIEFDGSALASGVYVYTISNEKGSVSKKMIINN